MPNRGAECKMEWSTLHPSPTHANFFPSNPGEPVLKKCSFGKFEIQKWKIQHNIYKMVAMERKKI